MDHLCHFCLVLLRFHTRLFVDDLWTPDGKGLTSWLSFPIGVLGQVWCLIVLILYLCSLSYFNKPLVSNKK